jgi:DNA (cytosine-5)-methyltransferase 1
MLPLTVREYARIQTFDDDYEFVGSLNSQYKQIGNAVPILLAKKMGESITNFLKINTRTRILTIIKNI